MRIHQRKQFILHELINYEDYITSETLAKTIGVSSRTVREDLKQLTRELAEAGIHITAHSGKGFKLSTADKTKARDLLTLSQQQAHHLPAVPADRQTYLLETLLFQTAPQTYDDLADPLYVSRSTVEKNLAAVETWLNEQNLTLVKKPAVGLLVQGPELSRRYAMVNFLAEIFHQDRELAWDLIKKRVNALPGIRSFVHKMQQTADRYFPDSAYNHLLYYLGVTLFRINNGHLLTDQPVQPVNIKQSAFANHLVKILEKEYGKPLPDAEIFAIHRYLQQVHPAPDDEVDPDSSLTHFIDSVLAELCRENHFDLCMDAELKQSLQTYLKTLLARQAPNIRVKNPSLSAIKAEYPQALDAAVNFSAAVYKTFGIRPSEDEIGYIALFLSAAVERNKQHNQPPRVVILCSTGIGGSQLLTVKIRRLFPDLTVCGVFPAYQLEKALQLDPDFIISTIPLKDSPKPVLVVSHLLNWDDFKQIRLFIDSTRPVSHNSPDLATFFREKCFQTGLKIQDQETIIQTLCTPLINHGFCQPEYPQAVLDREAIFSTAIGNLVAIPHALPDTSPQHQSCISVGILDRPVLWGKEKVQLVLLLHINHHHTRNLAGLYENLFDVLQNKDKVQRLIRAKTFLHFVRQL